jgi:hypothetical protein
VTDTPQDEPDLFAQATTAQPGEHLHHHHHSSSHRRRRRRRGPNYPLILGIVALVVVVGAGAYYVHKHSHKSSSTTTPTTTGGATDPTGKTWSHQDLTGAVVVLHNAPGEAFVKEPDGSLVPEVVAKIDAAAAANNCDQVAYIYLFYRDAKVTGAAVQRTGAIADYAWDTGKTKKCVWATASSPPTALHL